MPSITPFTTFVNYTPDNPHPDWECPSPFITAGTHVPFGEEEERS